MAKIPYVPFNESWVTLFTFCGIDLPTSDFGGQAGWGKDEFQNALYQVEDYLFENWDDDQEELFESYYTMAQSSYSVRYWSTEAIG